MEPDPALAVNYNYNFPAAPPTGNAQIIASSGATNVFYDVHPQNLVVVRTNPGPNEYASVVAALASIPGGTPTAASPWVIRIYPGTYAETAITIPSFIFLVGIDAEAVILTPAALGYPLITITGQGGMTNLSVLNTDPAFPALLVEDCGVYSIIRIITFSGCTKCIHVLTDGGATATSCFRGEIVTTINATNYSLLVEDTGGAFGSYVIVNDFYTRGHNDTAVTVNGSKSEIISQSSRIVSDGTGIGITVENSATFNAQGFYLSNLGTGVLVPVGGVPTIYLVGVFYDNCTQNLNILNTSTIGNNQGYTQYTKTSFPEASPFFVAGTDQHIITVSIKGGDFSSVAAALAAITDNSVTNRYTIQVGPGIFPEPQLVMKSYVAVVGFFQTQSILMAIDPTKPFVIGAGFAALNNLTLAGDNPMFPPNVYPPYLIEFMGNPTGLHFRVDGVVFGTGIGVVHIGSTGGPTIYIQLNCIINMQSAITTGITIEDSGPSNFPISYLIDGLVWVPLAASLVNFTKFMEVQSFLPSASPNIFGICIALTIGQRMIAPLGVGIQIDGPTFTVMSVVNLGGFATALSIPNSAEPNIIVTSGLLFYFNTIDISLQNPNGEGTIDGSATFSKISIVSGSAYGVNVIEPDGSIAFNGQLFQGTQWSRVTNITEQIQHAATLGIVDARPTVTPSGGLNVTIAAGACYIFVGPLSDNYLQYIQFPGATLTLPDNALSYIYVDSSATLQQSLSVPDAITATTVGTVKTFGGNVSYTQDIARQINALSTEEDEASRAVLGAIVVSGCIGLPGSSLVLRAVSISSGNYYFGSISYEPLGGNNITMIGYYGGVNEVPGINSVPLSWDNAGVLTPLIAGQWVKHCVYLISTIDTGACTYFMVYGQQVFADEASADLGPPACSTDHFRVKYAQNYCRGGHFWRS